MSRSVPEKMQKILRNQKSWNPSF